MGVELADSSPIVLLAVIVWAAMGAFSAFLASEKGRDGFGWFMLGVLFGPMALLAVGLSPAAQNVGSQNGILPNASGSRTLFSGKGGYTTALHEAVERQDKNAVAAILARAVDPDVYDSEKKTALMLAAENNYIEIVEILVDHGAALEPMDSKGHTALALAAKAGAVQAFCFLASRGAKFDKPLILALAVGYGRLEIVRKLIEEGVSPNQTHDSQTPLQRAAMGGHVELVRFLAKNGAELDAAGERQFRPIQLAAREGHLQIVRKLARYGADLNEGPYGLPSPLECAAERGHHTVVQHLLAVGPKDIATVKRAFKMAKDFSRGTTANILKEVLDYSFAVFPPHLVAI